MEWMFSLNYVKYCVAKSSRFHWKHLCINSKYKQTTSEPFITLLLNLGGAVNSLSLTKTLMVKGG